MINGNEKGRRKAQVSRRARNLPTSKSFLEKGTDAGPAPPFYKLKLTGAAASFVIATFLAHAIAGRQLSLYLDEGIYLHGAQRILAGQNLYEDWFGFTGPGTDWMFAAIFGLFGNSLFVAHLLLDLEIGSIAAAIYWLMEAGAGWLPLAASSSFVALLTIFPFRLFVNHRWDSLCLTLLSMLLIAKAPKPKHLICSGLLMGCAVIVTPPTAFISLATATYLLVSANRKSTYLFGLGFAAALISAAGFLFAQHSFTPMLQSFQWAAAHYQRANSVPYGFEPEYMSSQSGSSESLSEKLLLAIPSVLPSLALLLFLLSAWRRESVTPQVKWLLAAGIGAALSCYPRWSADQLLFTTPFFLGALFLMGSALLPSQRIRAVALCQLAICSTVIFFTLTARRPTVPVSTQLGEVFCRPQDQRSIEFATAAVQPGESLFVFPYQPIWYSLTGARNPTYYDFLQPGMMTAEDESETLRELEANPPQRVIWHNLPVKAIVAIWPNSNPSTFKFRRIEAFVRTNYRQVQAPDPATRYSIAIFGRVTPTGAAIAP